MSLLYAILDVAQKLIGVAAPVAQEASSFPILKNSVALKNIVAGLQVTRGLNWSEIEKAVTDHFANIQDDLTTAEDLAKDVAMFFPPAIYAADIATVLLVLAKLGDIRTINDLRAGRPDPRLNTDWHTMGGF